MKTTYCAFLRGINVGGMPMKMTEVISVFQKVGMTNVVSVLATGNILFSSDEKPENLKRILEKSFSEHFHYEAFLFIKTKEEVLQMVEFDPFGREEKFHNYVFIAEKGAADIFLEQFNALKRGEGEQAAVKNGIFYWQILKGQTLYTEFSKILGSKKMKDKFTSRNLNTIEKILKKM